MLISIRPMILINAKLPEGVTTLDSVFSWIGLLKGSYDDFRVGWYGDVGGALTLTMVINMVAPHCAPLLMLFVVTPLKRRFKRGKALTQRELDHARAGTLHLEAVAVRSSQDMLARSPVLATTTCELAELAARAPQ